MKEFLLVDTDLVLRSGSWAGHFHTGPITGQDFESFVLENLITQEGGEVLKREGQHYGVSLPAEPLLGRAKSADLQLVISESENPESEYQEWAAKLDGRDWLFVSMYGRPANMDNESYLAPNWIDGEDLQRRFFPVRLVTPQQESLICTIRPGYADGLIPSFERPGLFTPSRQQVRPDNVYYRSPDRYQRLRRGSYVFFYVSAPEKCIRGVGRVQAAKVGSPEELVAEFGSMGILDFDDLLSISKAGRVLAIVFDWYKEYTNKLFLDSIRQFVPNFNPIVANRVSYSEAQSLLEYDENSL